MRLRIAAGTLLLVTFTAMAEDQTTVRVTVTAVSGRSAFIDRGMNDDIKSGFAVRFFAPGIEEIEGIVRDVSVDSARVEVPIGIVTPPVGSQGEVEVDAPIAVGTDKGKGDDRDHPPWSRRLELQDPSEPLLAPLKRERPKDREPQWRGRVYMQGDYTWDNASDRDREYYIARTGLSLKARNPFKMGGQLTFSGQVSERGQNIEDEIDDERRDPIRRWRLDRFSYALGGHEFSPYRVEFGRFYSHYIPELGLIDGLEAAARFRGGLRIGGGIGWLPLPSPERETGDDFAAHLFVGYEPKGKPGTSAVLAYQKTWHLGEPDRDLILGRINLRPTDKIWVFGSLKADIYNSGDEVKNGIELTELYLQARYTPTRKFGVGLSGSHFSWPELLREEFGNPPEDLLRDGKVDRVELSSWYRIWPNFRVSGRVNYWKDQNSEGDGGQLAIDWTDIGKIGLSFHSSVRYNSSAFNEGIGYRFQTRKAWKYFSANLAYDAYEYETTSFEGDITEYKRESVRGGFDVHYKNWFANTSAHYDFGDGQDAYGVGLMIGYRFR